MITRSYSNHLFRYRSSSFHLHPFKTIFLQQQKQQLQLQKLNLNNITFKRISSIEMYSLSTKKVNFGFNIPNYMVIQLRTIWVDIDKLSKESTIPTIELTENPPVKPKYRKEWEPTKHQEHTGISTIKLNTHFKHLNNLQRLSTKMGAYTLSAILLLESPMERCMFLKRLQQLICSTIIEEIDEIEIDDIKEKDVKEKDEKEKEFTFEKNISSTITSSSSSSSSITSFTTSLLFNNILDALIKHSLLNEALNIVKVMESKEIINVDVIRKMIQLGESSNWHGVKKLKEVLERLNDRN